MPGSVKTWLLGLSTVKKIALGTATVVAANGLMNATQVSQSSETSTTPTEPAVQRQSVITTETITELQTIPFGTTVIQDGSLLLGKTMIKAQGVNGTKTLTHEIAIVDGVETERKLVSEVISVPPIDQVVAQGTKVQSACDQNYSGACVPIATDVDCAGGSGNGPAYVSGPVYVIGTDIYDLDRDGNGVACE